MEELDLNLNLLSGDPIPIEDVCSIYPLTLRQIKNLSTTIYNKYLGVTCIDVNDIQKALNTAEDIDVFETIYFSCKGNDEYKDIIFKAFKCFLREEIGLCDYGFHLGNENKIIHKGNYSDIIKIIKLQNCLVEKKEVEKYKPANERARKMLEQMKKNEEELNKVKSKDSLTLHDLISIFAAYSENINILNVWDMTFYQFNDQFNRLKIMKEYDCNLQILMHCDTSKNKIDLKHWLSPSQTLNK